MGTITAYSTGTISERYARAWNAGNSNPPSFLCTKRPCLVAGSSADYSVGVGVGVGVIVFEGVLVTVASDVCVLVRVVVGVGVRIP